MKRKNKVGNRLSMKVDDANAHCYGYDNLYQLIYVDYNDSNTTNYYYDALGNRTKVTDGKNITYTLNDKGLNQYGSVGGTSYSYDDNGNLIDDGTYKYYYDCENRLMDVNDLNGDPVASYAYDYLGRRIKKTIHDSQTTIHYTYDGDQVIAEYQGGNRTGFYVYGAGIDEPVYMYISGMAGGHYCHFDGLGSVVALSNYNGDIAERYSYDVFGEPNRASSVGNPYLFTGRRYDAETGLYYYRARYYHPSVGQFMQTDPVGYIMGLNLYMYVSNNPVNFVDPLGLWPSWIPIWPRDACYWCGRRIFNETWERFPGLEGRENFMRHCIANCDISRECGGGRACAFALGWLNEIFGTYDEADVAANAAGRSASRCEGLSCEDACSTAWEGDGEVCCD